MKTWKFKTQGQIVLLRKVPYESQVLAIISKKVYKFGIGKNDKPYLLSRKEKLPPEMQEAISQLIKHYFTPVQGISKPKK